MKTSLHPKMGCILLIVESQEGRGKATSMEKVLKAIENISKVKAILSIQIAKQI